jgi:myosin heavy subunit
MTTKIWISSKSQAWKLANLLSYNDQTDEVTVALNDGKQITLPKSQTHKTDDTHFIDVEDLCVMNHLHEAPLLDCLRRRFFRIASTLLQAMF